MTIAEVEHQRLIDRLTAAVLRQQVSKLFALGLIELVRAGLCPVCRAEFRQYQIVVQDHRIPVELDFYHNGVFLPCHLLIYEGADRKSVRSSD